MRCCRIAALRAWKKPTNVFTIYFFGILFFIFGSSLYISIVFVFDQNGMHIPLVCAHHRFIFDCRVECGLSVFVSFTLTHTRTHIATRQDPRDRGKSHRNYYFILSICRVIQVCPRKARNSGIRNHKKWPAMCAQHHPLPMVSVRCYASREFRLSSSAPHTHTHTLSASSRARGGYYLFMLCGNWASTIG